MKTTTATTTKRTLIIRIIGLAASLIALTGCSSLNLKRPGLNQAIEKASWYHPDSVAGNLDKLQTGDILVPQPSDNFLHAWMVAKNGWTVGFWNPDGYVRLRTANVIGDYQRQNRPIAVLRLKNRPPALGEALLAESAKVRHKPFVATPHKNQDHGLYCSQFIWLVYKRAGEQLGREIDLDANGGPTVPPQDLLRSGELEFLRF